MTTPAIETTEPSTIDDIASSIAALTECIKHWQGSTNLAVTDDDATTAYIKASLRYRARLGVIAAKQKQEEARQELKALTPKRAKAVTA